MKLVDSSGWLEFFTDGPLAERYAKALGDLDDVITPSIVLYEVYRWIKRERSEEEGLLAAAQIQKSRMIPLTVTVALTAADLGLEHDLASADAIVYATAILNEALLFTSDSDFASLPGVEFFGTRADP